MQYPRELLRQNIQLIRKRWRVREAIKTKPEDFFVQLTDIILTKAPCCFVLSTGRCGTELLTHIFNKSSNVDVYHTPSPELKYPSRLAYELGASRPEAFRMAALSARYELIQESVMTDRIYVETNNRITFFAPFLANVFHGSRFIHLIRHPGAFVRSGIGREYYVDPRVAHGLIIPTKDNSRIIWEGMSPIEKNAWLWNETNAYIEKFKQKVDSSRVLVVKAEDMFRDPDVASTILKFAGANPVPQAFLERRLRRPANKQRTGKLPVYKEWPESWKSQLRTYATLAERYGYVL